uniref:Histone-lysine N-methyltransferase ATX2 n=1 Tax=Ananas comosus var. bracteatus TaxID=296719 RepID=A0A6V7PLT2_ANACO|nr:unnamed protein product [Ananas comosus var. bracteatus]
MALAIGGFVHEEEEVDHPCVTSPRPRLLLHRPFASPSRSSNAIARKVRARRPDAALGGGDGDGDGDGGGGNGRDEVKEEAGEESGCEKEPFDVDDSGRGVAEKPILVYYRRRKKKACVEVPPRPGGSGDGEQACANSVGDDPVVIRRNVANYELLRLGAGSGCANGVSLRRLRGSSEVKRNNIAGVKRKERGVVKGSLWTGKKWVELEIEGADPNAFVGLACKASVFWPMDDDWYKGSVVGYNVATKQHCVEYNDGDTEVIVLSDERIKFHITYDELLCLNLKCGVPNFEKKGYNELLALAVSLRDYQNCEPGDLIWAKLTGRHAMWPAVVMDESNVGARGVLKLARVDQSVLVQFFGTHDFARIRSKYAIPFLNGLLSSLHLKCKQARFYRSLDEAKMYLSTQQLPKNMLQLQKSIGSDECRVKTGDDGIDSCDDTLEDDSLQQTLDCVEMPPIEMGNLRVTSLDPNLLMSYKMEVLRNPKLKTRPMFRVTTEDGEQIDGSTPSTCWKEIYSRIKETKCNNVHAEVGGREVQKSGSYMFGLSNPQICQLIQELPNSRLCTKYFESCGDLPAGYRAVHINWKDLDRCNVCDMDEEYEDNLFLQCDKCCMMVHARCYGELEPLNGVLWLCNLCRSGAPKSPPRCSLCPISETCLIDVKRMEPIDGISRISKDRWKLLCSICGVSYGACIQCSHHTCRVAYHPLCARAAGLCVEPEDDDQIRLMSLDEDDGQCIRLLSFCKKHRQPSNERPPADESLMKPAKVGSSHTYSSNPSGCARSEPYSYFGRRGQKQPQDLAAASLKRLFVENRPYLVGGYRQNNVGCSSSTNESLHNSGSSDTPQQETGNISSMAEKYRNMKATFRKRLAFGKSRIHGFGVFAKLAHKAGDMVIEYIGELVRPQIADIREKCIYNSLVGAGTYMFRIDDERVIDATRAGSIAHLINHSCEPNCYSRVITVNGDEHIIIFAKRDINQWEELTYDYRFFSLDEELSCYCGFPKCRGVVNDTEAEEQEAKIRVCRSDLDHWRGE